MFASFDKNLKAHVDLSEQELAVVHQHFQHQTYLKKTFLLKASQVCNFEAYLLKGCIKRYYIDQNGDETIYNLPWKTGG